MVRRFRKYRPRRRRTRTVTKAQALSKKGAKSQAHQILKLQRQVTLINRNVRDNTKWTQYSMALNATVGAVTAPTYSVWNLIQPKLWEPIFQTRSSGNLALWTPSKFRGRSIGLEVMAQIGAITGVTADLSQEPITATLFICFPVTICAHACLSIMNILCKISTISGHINKLFSSFFSERTDK